jgi:D-amino-acid dehydrogenase
MIQKKRKHVVVVGGGVIGSFCAYFLLQSGHSVTIVDKARLGNGCSRGNCGLIAPDRIFPLNMPGMLAKSIFWMVKKDSPLYIKPFLKPDMVVWFLQFMRRCRWPSALYSAAMRHQLLKSSVDVYRQFVEREKLNCHFRQTSLLYAYTSTAACQGYRYTAEHLQKFGIKMVSLSRRTMLQKEPSLRRSVVGGWMFESGGLLRPEALMQELHGALKESGARVWEQAEVIEFCKNRNRLEQIETSKGSIGADAFVIATGAWTPLLQRQLGCRIPINPGKGYTLTTTHETGTPEIPVFLTEKRIASLSWSNGFRLGGTMEFCGYDTSLNHARLTALLKGSDIYFRNQVLGEIEEAWAGLRPMTWDGLPFIDRPPELTNVIIAAGHNMSGISMAPATGKLVAELMNDEPPHIDPKPYRLSRSGLS